MSDPDHLHRLAPHVDNERAAAAFRRRRRQARSYRRGAWATGAMVLVVGASVVLLANIDDETPVRTGPAAEGEGPVTFEVLTVTQATDEMGTLRAATNEAEYAELRTQANAELNPPVAIDFDRQVVVSIVIADDACPPELTSFSRDGNDITPVFTETVPECEQPLIPKTFVVALDRAPLEPSFTLRLPADDVYGYEEQRLEVDLSGGPEALPDLALPTIGRAGSGDGQALGEALTFTPCDEVDAQVGGALAPGLDLLEPGQHAECAMEYDPQVASIRHASAFLVPAGHDLAAGTLADLQQAGGITVHASTGTASRPDGLLGTDPDAPGGGYAEFEVAPGNLGRVLRAAEHRVVALFFLGDAYISIVADRSPEELVALALSGYGARSGADVSKRLPLRPSYVGDVDQASMSGLDGQMGASTPWEP